MVQDLHLMALSSCPPNPQECSQVRHLALHAGPSFLIFFFVIENFLKKKRNPKTPPLVFLAEASKKHR
jgi:hypothetical protein